MSNKTNKKRGKLVVRDFLRAESIDELVSSEEKELFRTKRFLSRQMIMHEIELLQKKPKRPVKIGKLSYFSQKQKAIDYKPLKYKPITYIPLKARNMFRVSYRRRLKKGKVRRNKSYYTPNRLGHRRMKIRTNSNTNARETKGYLEGIVQAGEPKILSMPQYQIGRGYTGYANRAYTKAA